jgi:hypothetical protein
MKDVVIGAINNYGWDQIKYWVNSLDRSGFDGSKIMLCYNIGYDVAEKLKERNYTILAFGKDDENKKLVYNNPNQYVYNDRFEHIPAFLKKLSNKEEYRYIISADVRDIIFQSNPSTWLENNMGDKALNISTESILLKDEKWNTEVTLKRFGAQNYEELKDKPVLNVGIVSGKFDYVLDLFTNLSVMFDNRYKFQQDQPGLMLLMNMLCYKNISNFTKSEDGFACNLHIHQPNYNKEKLIEPSPKIINGVVCTNSGIPYSIVHQYDRIPEYVKLIEEKYGD